MGYKFNPFTGKLDLDSGGGSSTTPTYAVNSGLYSDASGNVATRTYFTVSETLSTANTWRFANVFSNLSTGFTGINYTTRYTPNDTQFQVGGNADTAIGIAALAGNKNASIYMWADATAGGVFACKAGLGTDYVNCTMRFFVAASATSQMTLNGSGYLGLGVATASEMLDVNHDAIRIRQSQTPATASATGDAGMLAWDSGYIYVCTATNVWKRSALATW